MSGQTVEMPLIPGSPRKHGISQWEICESSGSPSPASLDTPTVAPGARVKQLLQGRFAEGNEMIDVAFVKMWSAHYPVQYDKDFYDPYIARARTGDAVALRKVTEWKNVGQGQRPMRLSRKKEISLQTFLRNIARYITDAGKENLRNDYSRSAPVWSIFWHHVLFQTPIFDVYTRMGFHWDSTGVILKKADAKIHPPTSTVSWG
jgi:hypothetical protein